MAHASHSVAAPAHVKMGGTLVVDNETGGLWTGNYSPFTPNVSGESIGIIYEPLVFINVLNGKYTPWLATSYSWANGNKTLTFDLRHGVTWTDGKPFTAADVAFTFNLMKKFPGADVNAVWTVLKSVTAQGTDKVVMTFKQQAVPYFYYIADQDGIVSQHIWSKVKNPVTYIDKNPIGTGPFTVSPSSSPQTITYLRNPHYWRTGKPYLDKVLYPAFTSNPPANLQLAEGKADWGGQFIPNIDNYYIKRNPKNFHYWFPPTQFVNIYLNLTVKPLNNKLVRQAIAYGIDRNRVSQIGEYGYEPPAPQNYVLLPDFASWYDRSLAAKYNYTYNPTKAKALLAQAGFKNKRISLSIINVGGNTDWVASLGVVKDDLKQIGIDLSIQNLSSNDYNARTYNGRFELSYQNGSSAAPNPYYDLRFVLFSGGTAPIGQAAAANYERWRDPTSDRLLNQFSATTNTALQHQIINKLQGIMLENVPVIPVTEGVSWFQYDTTKFTGWPTRQNPYVDPAPYDVPDWEIVLQNVHLK
jgi:peptide/nickel transport system substrate-binding protein